MALLKATQPQADLSLQALMFRIEQLESALGGTARAAAAAASAAAGPEAPPRRASRGAAVAVAARSMPRQAPQPVGSVELEQIVALWPAVAEAVAEENGMLGAALSAATPAALEGDRLTVAFAADAAFVRKKAEAKARSARQRGARAHRPAAGARVRAERRAPAPRARPRSTTTS